MDWLGSLRHSGKDSDDGELAHEELKNKLKTLTYVPHNPQSPVDDSFEQPFQLFRRPNAQSNVRKSFVHRLVNDYLQKIDTAEKDGNETPKVDQTKDETPLQVTNANSEAQTMVQNQSDSKRNCISSTPYYLNNNRVPVEDSLIFSPIKSVRRKVEGSQSNEQTSVTLAATENDKKSKRAKHITNSTKAKKLEKKKKSKINVTVKNTSKLKVKAKQLTKSVVKRSTRNHNSTGRTTNYDDALDNLTKKNVQLTMATLDPDRRRTFIDESEIRLKDKAFDLEEDEGCCVDALPPVITSYWKSMDYLLNTSASATPKFVILENIQIQSPLMHKTAPAVQSVKKSGIGNKMNRNHTVSGEQFYSQLNNTSPIKNMKNSTISVNRSKKIVDEIKRNERDKSRGKTKKANSRHVISAVQDEPMDCPDLENDNNDMKNTSPTKMNQEYASQCVNSKDNMNTPELEAPKDDSNKAIPSIQDESIKNINFIVENIATHLNISTKSPKKICSHDRTPVESVQSPVLDSIGDSSMKLRNRSLGNASQDLKPAEVAKRPRGRPRKRNIAQESITNSVLRESTNLRNAPPMKEAIVLLEQCVFETLSNGNTKINSPVSSPVKSDDVFIKPTSRPPRKKRATENSKANANNNSPINSDDVFIKPTDRPPRKKPTAKNSKGNAQKKSPIKSPVKSNDVFIKPADRPSRKKPATMNSENIDESITNLSPHVELPGSAKKKSPIKSPVKSNDVFIKPADRPSRKKPATMNSENIDESITNLSPHVELPGSAKNSPLKSHVKLVDLFIKRKEPAPRKKDATKNSKAKTTKKQITRASRKDLDQSLVQDDNVTTTKSDDPANKESASTESSITKSNGSTTSSIIRSDAEISSSTGRSSRGRPMYAVSFLNMWFSQPGTKAQPRQSITKRKSTLSTIVKKKERTKKVPTQRYNCKTILEESQLLSERLMINLELENETIDGNNGDENNSVNTQSKDSGIQPSTLESESNDQNVADATGDSLVFAPKDNAYRRFIFDTTNASTDNSEPFITIPLPKYNHTNMGRIIIKPGFRKPNITLKNYNLTIFVQSGTGIFRLQNKTSKLSTSMFVRAYDGNEYSIFNDGLKELSLVYSTSSSERSINNNKN